MSSRLDGVFFTAKKGNNYQIRMKVEENFGEPRIVTDGSITLVGFLYEAERDKYFNTWHDEELESYYRMEHQMYAADPKTQLKLRIRLSNDIQRLMNRVQKRAGIKDS